MKYTFIAAALAAGAMSLGGCATITRGKTDSVSVTSVPVDGAKCSLKNGVGEWYLTTPGSADVHKSKTDLQIDCTRDGYEPAHVTMQSHFEGMTAGNLIIGGVIGIGIDAASGAMNHYDKAAQVTLVPVAPAAAPMPAPAPADTSTPAKPQS
mgnify:CR=1 FL=1